MLIGGRLIAALSAPPVHQKRDDHYGCYDHPEHDWRNFILHSNSSPFPAPRVKAAPFFGCVFTTNPGRDAPPCYRSVSRIRIPLAFNASTTTVPGTASSYRMHPGSTLPEAISIA